MLDNVDRDCCTSVEKILTNNLGGLWKVVDRTFWDPHITLVLEHKHILSGGHPRVTVKILYGDK